MECKSAKELVREGLGCTVRDHTVCIPHFIDCSDCSNTLGAFTFAICMQSDKTGVRLLYCVYSLPCFGLNIHPQGDTITKINRTYINVIKIQLKLVVNVCVMLKSG